MRRILTAIPLLGMLFYTAFALLPAAPVSAAAGDGASSNIQLLDTDANGKINRITFDIANPNGETWQLAGASPYGLSVTMGGNGVTISSVSLATAATANPVTVQVDLDEGDSDLLTSTDGVTAAVMELIYTQQTGDHTCTNCINDSTDEELNTIAFGDTGATDTEADAAAPVITILKYLDNDGNGKIDRFTLTFSETVTAASVLGANDLTLTNVGDFTGAAFGADVTDLIVGSVSTVTVVLGTEATVLDTKDDSGNLAVSTQNAFSLTDGTNTNTTLGAQSLATIVDGASPVISTFTYLDNDGDGQIDAITVAFSETVIEQSALAANDLTFTNVGDFTGAAFGADATDLITTAVSSTTITLGTEASVNDTTEDSGNIAISTQNGFDLRDNDENTNTTLGAQSQATFIDGAEEPSSSLRRKILLQQQEQAQQDAMDEAMDQEAAEPDQPTEGDDPADDQMTDTPQEETTDTDENASFGQDVLGNPITVGSLIRGENDSAVYYVDANGVRHVFTNIHVYRSWYGDSFDQVVPLSDEVMASLPLGMPVTFKPGIMIKIRTLPHVYLIVGNRQIRHIANEQVAESLFGSDWNKMIYDVDDTFFINYRQVEDPIEGENEVDLQEVNRPDRRVTDELTA